MKVLSEIAKDALELSTSERLILARILLDASDPYSGYSSDDENEWAAEICRRIEAVRAGTAKTRPLEDVLADLDKRFPS